MILASIFQFSKILEKENNVCYLLENLWTFWGLIKLDKRKCAISYSNKLFMKNIFYLPCLAKIKKSQHGCGRYGHPNPIPAQCPFVPVSLCPCVLVSWCPSVPVSQPQPSRCRGGFINYCNCSAWLRLKLNTKMGLNHHTTLHYTPLHYTTLHPTPPPGTFRPLLDQLESWNLAQTLTRPTWLT